MRAKEIINEPRLGNAAETAQRMYDKYAGLNYTAYDRAVDHSQNYESNTPQYQYWIDVAREIDRLERADTAKKKKSNLEEARVRYEDLVLDYSIDGANVDVRAIVDGKQVAYVVFLRDGKLLIPDDLAVDEEYRGRGIAKKMYDWVKSLPQGFRIIRSGIQTNMGKRFWDKNRGEHVDVWEEGVAEGSDAEAYKEKLLTTLPQIMRFFEKNGKGWKPSKEQMLAAVETGYTVMKHTGDVKQAGKAMMDELNTLHRMGQDNQDVAEGLNEFATGSGGGGKDDILKTLAAQWLNGDVSSGDLDSDIQSQEKVERRLARGIICPDGVKRKLYIDYSDDYKGVVIYSDDNWSITYKQDDLTESKQGVAEAWSEKYKKSINCKNPKGFSQRAHCQGRKKK